MTVCGLARLVSPTGEVFITAASDSEVSATDTRLYGLVDKSKLFKVKDSVVAISGSGSCAEAVEDLLMDRTFLDTLDLCTRQGVRALGEQIYTLFKETAERSLTPEVVQHAGSILIGTPNAIYKMYPDFSCYAFLEFSGTGIGEESFVAAMTVLMRQLKELDNPSHDDLDRAIKEAVEVACTHCLHCNPPVHLMRPALKCEPPKPKKGRKPKKESEFLV